ncbi:hypothetical protein [Natrononativus amylolyticus]|nr:hypothetical protein [Natrononativus amylolyticus]
MTDEDFPPRPRSNTLGVNQEEIEWLQAIIDARRTRVRRGGDPGAED